METWPLSSIVTVASNSNIQTKLTKELFFLSHITKNDNVIINLFWISLHLQGYRDYL